MANTPTPTAADMQHSNPVLMEALADAAKCSPSDAAEHFIHIDPESRTPVTAFLEQYAA